MANLIKFFKVPVRVVELLLPEKVVIIGCAIFLVLGLLTPGAVHADHTSIPHRHILLLNSYHQTMTWVDNIVQAVKDGLDPAENNLVLHIEHMDTKRHNSQSYLESLHKAYKAKYADIDFDLILASDNYAFDFLRQHRDELFPGVPVVFCGVNDFQDEQIANLDGFTGVAEVFDSAATLELALKNHPNTRQVYIVNDYLKTGKAWKRTIKQQLEPFASRLKLTYSDDLSLDELEHQLARLDKDSLVLLGVYFADRNKNYVTYEHIGKVLAHSSKVPVYCLLEFNIGEGVIGGNVIGGYYQGQAMTAIARRILQGEPANSIPVQTKGANRYVFDAQQLQHFNIDISNLPEEAIIINQLPPLFQVSKASLSVFIGIVSLISCFAVLLYFALHKKKQIEAALLTSEARFKDIAMSMGDWAWEVDSRGFFRYCSEKVVDLLGYTTEEIIGKTPYDLMPPEQAEIARKFMKGIIADKKSFQDFENWNLHKNGSRVCFLTNGVPIFSAAGKIVGYRGVDKDITEKRAVEKEAAQRQAEFEVIINSISDAIVFTDSQRRIMMVNPAFTRMFDYQLEEVAGQTTQIIYANPENYLKQGNERFNPQATIDQFIFGNEYRRKDGTSFSGETLGSKVTNENGELIGFLGVIRDITERKQAEEALKKSDETINLLLNSTVEGVCGVDVDGLCTFCNQSALDLLGYEEQELIGQPLHNLTAHTNLDGTHIPREECAVLKIITSKEAIHDNDAVFWRADGSWLNVEYRAQPIIQEGKAVGAVLTFLDITEKKKLLAQQLRTSQLVSLGELAAGMAHEINNPIGGVINYAQMLLNKHPEESGDRDILERIIKEGDRVAAIVRNLLSFAYKDRDDITTLQVEKILEEPMQMVSQQMDRDGIYLDIDIADDLPSISGNAQRLGQVMLNLISNARYALNVKYPKADPNKILRISAQQKESNNKKHLQLIIWDQGCGVAKQHLEKVFNPFFTTKAAGTGTGLGLSVSHDILIEHGATVNIESDVGDFTKVTIEFPVIKEAI